MVKTSPRQRKTIGRVMHEFEHGELKSGAEGSGGKVVSRRQAIAIALSESGASNFVSKTENERTYAKTKRKESLGQTAQQEKEGKGRIGAHGHRESSPAMGGTNATTSTKVGAKAARTRARGPAGATTKATLYERAKAKGVDGRSRMTKQQLLNALA